MSKKLIIILIIIWVAVIGAVTATVLFVKPGLLVEDKTFYDERTGKSFDIVDGKVQFYLPVRMASVSDNDYENFEITAKYDGKASKSSTFKSEERREREDKKGTESSQVYDGWSCGEILP